MPDGRYEATETVEAADGDLELRAAVEIDGEEIRIDFAGTAGAHRGNLNCPLAVTVSACCFVLRVIADPDAPASGGAYAPLTVTAPEGSLVNARRPAAVVAGNVETSSRIADCLLRAFGQAVDAPAQGQGTMNNLTFGSPRFTYYETIGGGQGGSAAGTGAVGRPRGDVEHAQHAGRGARGRLPAARRALRAAGRERGRGAPPGRRRRDPGDHGARAVRGLDPLRPPPPPTPRRRRGRRGQAGHEPPQPPPARSQGARDGSRPGTRSRSARRAAAATVRPDADRRRRRRGHRGRRRRGRAAARPRPRARAARRARRGRARRLGVGLGGRGPRRRRRPRRAGRRVLLDRHRRLDRRQQGRTASARRCAPTPRPPPAPAAGTTPTCSRSRCAPPPRPCSPRSSTPGSARRPSPEADDRANVAHLDEI